jgi:uncharacterized cupin superfamily protein
MACSARVVVQAQLVETEGGLVPKGDGWFILNARDTQWWKRSGLGTVCDFEGEPRFRQLGINLTLLEPGKPMAMYHWEADQEDFLVLSGEALLVIEGDERTIRQWDFVHCPPGTNHAIIGAGTAPCLLLAVEHTTTAQKGKSGARTPWTRQRCATAQASNARRLREARRTRDSRRGG